MAKLPPPFDDGYGRELTLRERAAVAAMQGILAANPQADCAPPIVASLSIKFADALVVELNKGK